MMTGFEQQKWGPGCKTLLFSLYCNSDASFASSTVPLQYSNADFYSIVRINAHRNVSFTSLLIQNVLPCPALSIFYVFPFSHLVASTNIEASLQGSL